MLRVVPTSDERSDGPSRLVGTQIAQYRVIASLGKGGMGEVFRALDVKLQREVAIKVLPARAQRDPEFVARFLREARAASALNHPGVVTVHDIVLHEGQPCIVMELVAGRSLDTVLREGGPLPVERALRLCAATADALAVAHENGIVHRDVKSANLMVTSDDRVKVLDFGLAKRTGERESGAPGSTASSDDNLVTAFGSRMGTLGYVSLELARGENADARTDIFSLGCVLYELCVGVLPFPNKGWTEAILAIGRKRWVRPSRVVGRGLPIALDALLEKCFAPLPKDRWATMREMADAMRWIVNDRATTRARGGLSVGGLLACAFAGLVMGGASGVAFWRYAKPPIAAPMFAIGTKPPTIIGDVSDDDVCTIDPAYTPDGGLLYVVHKGDDVHIHRRELATGADRVLVSSAGENRYPIAGPGGSVIYQHADAGNLDHVDLFRALSNGAASERIKAGATQAAFVGDRLYYVRDDTRGVRRLSLDGTSDELVYESGTPTGFGALSVSSDGRMLAARQIPMEERRVTTICVGPTAHEGKSFDCTVTNDARSNAVFAGASGEALYWSRGNELVRYTVSTRYIEKLPLPRPAYNVAIAPDGKQLAASDCHPSWNVATLASDGKLTTLSSVVGVGGVIAVGPHGELAFPNNDQARSDLLLAARDATGAGAGAGAMKTRTLATGARITEAAFAPNTSEVAFHDAGEGGGLFVVPITGDRAPRRLTNNAEDSVPLWLGDDELLFLRPEAGFPYGRAHRVSVNGGAATALNELAGLPIGYDKTRGALLLWSERPTGDQFFWRFDDGRVEPIHFDVPADWKIERYTATSSNGRYLTSFAKGAAWRIDLQTNAVQRIDYASLARQEQTIQADDDGNIVMSYKTHRGHLWLLDGNFR